MTGDVFSHPWLGGLFGDAHAAAIWSPDRQLAHMLRVEAAYTHALGAVGSLPSEKAARVSTMIMAFAPDIAAINVGTARDGVPVPDLVRQIKAAAGADADAVHKGMTSQDVIDTALALTLQDFNNLINVRLADLSAGLKTLTQKFGAVQIMGRTRMQAALPILFAQRATSWSAPIITHQARLAALRPKVEAVQLGGPVGDRAAIGPQANAIAAEMAAALGLTDTPTAWHSQREAIVDYTNLLSLITGTLGKMGQDIALMTQQGVDEAQISGGGGSSAMPHKQNPVLAELLVTLARFNATQISGMHHALVHEQERSGAAWGLEWMILPQMAMSTARSIIVAHDLCLSLALVTSNEI
ncbi:MAG: 3-carboxy-cis,cis-muconate cycloisomerase [Loktanella sp.]|nr:3-carboxy-cis,cis-muconate cycloisomerase [Loktanella sp.]